MSMTGDLTLAKATISRTMFVVPDFSPDRGGVVNPDFAVLDGGILQKEGADASDTAVVEQLEGHVSPANIDAPKRLPGSQLGTTRIRSPLGVRSGMSGLPSPSPR